MSEDLEPDRKKSVVAPDGPARVFTDGTVRAASRLRFPRLLALFAVLFVVDLVMPDFLPFVDEILLGLMTVILASLKKKRQAVPRA